MAETRVQIGKTRGLYPLIKNNKVNLIWKDEIYNRVAYGTKLPASQEPSMLTTEMDTYIRENF